MALEEAGDEFSCMDWTIDNDYSYICPNCRIAMRKAGKGGHICPKCRTAVTSTWEVIRPVPEVPGEYEDLENKILKAKMDISRDSTQLRTFEEVYGTPTPSIHDLFKGVMEVVKEAMEKDEEDADT
jgi:Zn-finger nucleic acid-binding protein